MNDTTRPPCLCGCGGFPKGAKARFIPGHDARFHARQRAEQKAAETPAPKPNPRVRVQHAAVPDPNETDPYIPGADGAQDVYVAATRKQRIGADRAALCKVDPEHGPVLEVNGRFYCPHADHAGRPKNHPEGAAPASSAWQS